MSFTVSASGTKATATDQVRAQVPQSQARVRDALLVLIDEAQGDQVSMSASSHDNASGSVVHINMTTWTEGAARAKAA